MTPYLSATQRREPCALEAPHPEFLNGDNTIEQLRYLVSVGSSIHDSTTILHISLLEVTLQKWSLGPYRLSKTTGAHET